MCKLAESTSYKALYFLQRLNGPRHGMVHLFSVQSTIIKIYILYTISYCKIIKEYGQYIAIYRYPELSESCTYR